MLWLIVGIIIGVVAYPYVAPFALPLIEKVKSMFNKSDDAPVEDAPVKEDNE